MAVAQRLRRMRCTRQRQPGNPRTEPASGQPRRGTPEPMNATSDRRRPQCRHPGAGVSPPHILTRRRSVADRKAPPPEEEPPNQSRKRHPSRGTPEPVTPAPAQQRTPRTGHASVTPHTAAAGHSHASRPKAIPTRPRPQDVTTGFTPLVREAGRSGCPPRRSSHARTVLSGGEDLARRTPASPSDPIQLDRHAQDRPHPFTVPAGNRFPAPIVRQRLNQLQPPPGLLVLVGVAHGRRAER